MHCVTPVCLQTLLAPTRRVTRPADKALLVDNLNVSHKLKRRSPHRQNIFSGGLKRKFININVARPTGEVAPPARCQAGAISNANFIISRKEFCLSSADNSSPVSRLSEMVHMHSAFLPARAALW